jgi:hypothetical protein
MRFFLLFFVFFSGDVFNVKLKTGVDILLDRVYEIHELVYMCKRNGVYQVEVEKTKNYEEIAGVEIETRIKDDKYNFNSVVFSKSELKEGDSVYGKCRVVSVLPGGGRSKNGKQLPLLKAKLQVGREIFDLVTWSEDICSKVSRSLMREIYFGELTVKTDSLTGKISLNAAFHGYVDVKDSAERCLQVDADSDDLSQLLN